MAWSPRHVKGHTNKNGHIMDWWEESNDKMDNAAKAHRQQTQDLTRPNPSIPLSRYKGWHIFHNERRLTPIYAPITKTYWIRRKHIQPLAKRKRYWDGIKYASSQLCPGKCRWMDKHVTEICGVWKWMKK
jgi:hypothetical protein